MKKCLIISMVVALVLTGCLMGSYARTQWDLLLVQPAIDGILKIRTIATGEYDIDQSGAAVPLGEGYILALTHCTNPDKVLLRTMFGTFNVENKVESVEYTVNGKEAVLVGRKGDLSLFRCPYFMDPYSIPWGDSDDIRPGDRILSIGTTYGLPPLLADGIIAAVGFIPPEGADGLYENRFLFYPNPGPGDSGTPIISVDSWGKYRVVGITDQLIGKLGSAIKSNYILETVESLKV